MSEPLERLTLEELARAAYLAVVSMDDAIPDDVPGYAEAVRLTDELWKRLRPATCKVEGCNEPHTPSFPWCVVHLQEWNAVGSPLDWEPGGAAA